MRSKWKGFFQKIGLLRQAEKPEDDLIAIYSRATVLTPIWLTKLLAVYNGKKLSLLEPTPLHLWHRFGEFAQTRAFFVPKKKKKKQLAKKKKLRMLLKLKNKSFFFKKIYSFEERYTVSISILLAPTFTQIREMPRLSLEIFTGFQLAGEFPFLKNIFILPGCAFTEKKGTYWNIFGEKQTIETIFQPIGLSQPDWANILDLYNSCYKTILLCQFAFLNQIGVNNDTDFFQNSMLLSLRTTAKGLPFLKNIQKNMDPFLVHSEASPTTFSFKLGLPFNVKTGSLVAPVIAFTDNFYKTDSISNLSNVMSICSKNDIYIL